MSSASSVLPSDLVSVEVAAQQVGAPPSDLVDQVHVSGALSGACTGKGSQMANPRPTPKPGNLGPQTSLTRCTFPVLYPVLAPERGPEWQTHARRRNLGRVLREGNQPRYHRASAIKRKPLSGDARKSRAIVP